MQIKLSALTAPRYLSFQRHHDLAAITSGWLVTGRLDMIVSDRHEASSALDVAWKWRNEQEKEKDVCRVVRLDVKSMIILAYLPASMTAAGARKARRKVCESIGCGKCHLVSTDCCSRRTMKSIWLQVSIALAGSYTARLVLPSNFRPTSQSYSRPSWLRKHAMANHLLDRWPLRSATRLPSSGRCSRHRLSRAV